MQYMPVDRSFLGTGWAFPPEFNRTSRKVKMVDEDDDIRESLYILISTTPGERTLQPAYGCELRSIVFEVFTESTITEIKDIIERAILFFEPRIDLNFIEIETDEIVQGILKILVDYTVRATNSRSNMVYPFYFQEGTSIQM
jgi:phage baseplate assembly protein W